MIIKLNKNITVTKKIEQISLLAIYIFLLVLTSFHFHPIDLANSKSILDKAPIEKSEHGYTTKDCPILNFAQNGFNSTNFISSVSDIKLEITKLLFPTTNFRIEKNFGYSFQLRGPPSSLFF